MSSARVLLLRRTASVSAITRRDPSRYVIVRYHATGKSPLSTSAATTQQPAASSLLPKEDATTSKSTTIPTGSKSKAYADLAKAKLSSLVVATTACGFLAAGGPFDPAVLSSCVVGTALCSSSAAAWNQILEVDRDSKMKRTQQRPLVQQTLSMGQAQAAATLWGASGVGLLYLGTDPVTALLGASNIALYSGLYTYMKPRSIYNTWVGAVVGAIPPVMGWTAATGGSLLDIEVALLGATLFTWQMPHFFALSFMHRQDYARGGFAMVPVLEMMNQQANYSKTAQLITRYAAYLSTIPFVATATGVTSSMFAFEGLALNAYALHVAHKFSKDRTNANARKVFLTSLWYLPSFMMLFLLHSKVWDTEETENKQKDAVQKWIADRVHKIRELGRQVCIHEKAIVRHEDEETSKQACPVALGQQKGREGVEALKRRATEAAAAAGTKETSA